MNLQNELSRSSRSSYIHIWYELTQSIFVNTKIPLVVQTIYKPSNSRSSYGTHELHELRGLKC